MIYGYIGFMEQYIYYSFDYTLVILNMTKIWQNMKQNQENTQNTVIRYVFIQNMHIYTIYMKYIIMMQKEPRKKTYSNEKYRVEKLVARITSHVTSKNYYLRHAT